MRWHQIFSFWKPWTINSEKIPLEDKEDLGRYGKFRFRKVVVPEIVYMVVETRTTKKSGTAIYVLMHGFGYYKHCWMQTNKQCLMPNKKSEQKRMRWYRHVVAPLTERRRQHIIINIFKPSRWILVVFLMYLTRYSVSIFDTVTIIYMILYRVTCTNIVTPPLAFSTFKK